MTEILTFATAVVLIALALLTVRRLNRLVRNGEKAMLDLKALVEEVHVVVDVVQSATKSYIALAAEMEACKSDPAQVQALVDELRAVTGPLAAAVANTTGVAPVAAEPVVVAPVAAVEPAAVVPAPEAPPAPVAAEPVVVTPPADAPAEPAPVSPAS